MKPQIMRDSEVAALRLDKNISLKSIAADYGLSIGRVSQIVWFERVKRKRIKQARG